MSSDQAWLGGCQCGGIRYVITAPPLTLYACHCTECQRQSSSAFGLSMPVPRSGFTVTQGNPQLWTRTADSGRVVRCAFCPDCGTRLYHLPTRNDAVVNVKPGTLDDTSWLRPVAHVWTSSAQPWVIIPPNVLRYERQPPDFEALYAAWGAWCERANEASPVADSIAGVRAGYDRWAAVYDHDANPLPALEAAHVRTAAGDVRGLSVLDFGCGTGRHTTWLAAAGATVTAIDFSKGMLAEARRKPGSANVRFLTHDLRAPLPFADAAFDLVVSGLVLEHLQDLSGPLAEVRRVLRRDGRAIVSEIHPAMLRSGSQARFTDPTTGEVVRPGSVPHQLRDFVVAASQAELVFEDLVEAAPDAAFAARYPRAAKYVGFPMLLVMCLRADDASRG